MFGSEILDVAIGMAFFFLAVSLISSAVAELIEGVLKKRAQFIEQGIRELLRDPDGSLTEQLFNHPLVFSLFSGRYSASSLTPAAGSTREEGVPVSASARHMPLSARRSLPSYIPAASFARALMDLVGNGPQGQYGSGATLNVAQFRNQAGLLPEAQADLRRAILTATEGVRDDLAQVQRNLEAWYDTTMDRVSGWYKRRTTFVLFLIGLVTAVALNLDSLTIASRLSTDSALRDRFVAEGQRTIDGGTLTPVASTTPQQRVADQRALLESLSAPVGWAESGLPAAQCTIAGDCDSALEWLPILLGWLVTAVAVTLGAPFWFDLLNRFMIVRSTIKPHEKSPEEPPIDGPRGSGGTSASPSPTAPPAGSSIAATAPAVPARSESPPLPLDEDLDAPAEVPVMIPEEEEELI